MRATGIVRRIDELGRVVIPKEIRRTQRIKSGDSLEIFTDKNGEVVFKKYSPLAELGEPAALYAAPAAGPRLPLGERHTLLCAAPILARGDMEGGVLLPGTARDPLPDAETVQAAAIAAEFLARWMEE